MFSMKITNLAMLESLVKEEHNVINCTSKYKGIYFFESFTIFTSIYEV